MSPTERKYNGTKWHNKNAFAIKSNYPKTFDSDSGAGASEK